ncbi:MAG TPA: DUF2017 family protein [Acidimicrobiales bacterium]|nr:DUF2017 family protein [Acidimicrobiales bacterium]
MIDTPPNGIARTPDGKFSVRLSPHEKSVLASLPGQAQALATGGDPSTIRLFPPAYVEDTNAEAEYVTLMRGDLMDGCVEALETFRKTISSETISEEEALQWLRAVNSIRLIIGTKINVQEGEQGPDPETVTAEDTRSQGMLLYGYLTWLEQELIDAISESDGSNPSGGD